MAESQNIEWKESWRDEYLKWICGFANAQGGKIYIGVDDTGKVVGVQNGKRLLEEIPNKMQCILVMNAYSPPIGQWSPCYKGINPDHIIPKLRGRFSELAILKAGDGDSKNF